MTIVTPTSPRAADARSAPDLLGSELDSRQQWERRAREGHQAVFVGNDTVLCRVLGSLLCYVDANDRALGPHLIMNGCWEPWVTVAMARMLKPGMICVDVGSNLGYFTMLMASGVGPGGAVVAFEPNPRLADLCESSLYLNGFREHCHVSTFAVSDRDGNDVPLSFASHLPMNGTIVAKTPSPDAVSVKTVTLDTACSKLARLDLVKIDAEGAEEKVWDGMQGLLDRHRGVTIVLEWNAQRGEAERLLDKILRRFPTLHHIDFTGEVVPIAKSELMTARGHEDFMLVLRNDG